jgi:putative signal transducing protein
MRDADRYAEKYYSIFQHLNELERQAGKASMATENEWITVARYVSPMEAEMAKSRLESAGIASFLAGENSAILYGTGLGGLQLQVRPRDKADARAILAEPDLQEELGRQEKTRETED